MEQPKSFYAFLLGAVVGVAVGYYLASDNKEEIIEDLKGSAQKLKDKVDEQVERGKKFADDLKNKVNDILDG